MSEKAARALEVESEDLVLKLKRREVVGSGAVCTVTAKLLLSYVAKRKYTSVQELLDTIRKVGKRLADAQPMELAIGNIVRRVLFIIRHECTLSARSNNEGDEGQQQSSVDLSLSLHKLLDSQDEIDFSRTPFKASVSIERTQQPPYNHLYLRRNQMYMCTFAFS
jgi:translation initiation factor eIF-2B subunit beta